MIAGDVVRCGATGGIGVLAVLGDIRIWHVLLLIAVYDRPTHPAAQAPRTLGSRHRRRNAYRCARYSRW